MIIKIIGCLLIIAGAWGIGLYLAYKPFYRKSALNSFNVALELLENEINNYSSLIEAFYKISKKLKDKEIGNVFLRLYNRMKEKRGENIEEIWLDILEQEKNKLFLVEEDIESLKEFGTILNGEDRELELKNIKLLKKYIYVAVDEINGQYLKNKKMLQSVGLLGGLMIAIALI